MTTKSTGTSWLGGTPHRSDPIRICTARTGRRLLALAVVVAISVAGCGDSNGDSEQARTDTADVAGAEVAGVGEDAGGDAGIAPCTLLSDDEAAQVLGGPIVDIESAGEDSCRWKVEDGWSVTIDFFSPGTAPGNEFDPTSVYGGSSEPVSSLEGAWYVGMGTVAFASHERVITVMVATGIGDAGRGAAEELAPLVHQRIEEAAA